ncbi:hypothetical protein [Maridesulfovibrio sp. FT414]|uniref:hypothetical protein n=1 Tax=Maridesulfovibrio sp. FT414 TaxID=2979469 RepID=UPI003D8081F6
MRSDNTAITAAEFPLALFMLGMPLILAAYSLSGLVAPANTADVLMTGLAVLGFIAEPFRDQKSPDIPLWIKAGIPALLITCISFHSFARFTPHLMSLLPFLMEAKPLLYLMVTLLWASMFGIPTSKQISFWALWLAILLNAEFWYGFLEHNLAIEPNILGHYTLTGPSLLAGLCATLHHKHENRIQRLIILIGIFCTLSRDNSLTAVLILLMFGPKGLIKKFILILVLLFFSYVSLIPQDMTMLNRNDLPQYWIWFAVLELLARNPMLLLTGFPLSVPVPLSVPASIWNIWHEQHYVWTGQGVYLFHITPLWLHLITAWGLGGIVIAATAATAFYRRHSSAMTAGLLTAVFMTGFFSPLIYSGPSAIVLFLAFTSATRSETQTFSFE